MENNSDKKVLVTGASSGIGKTLVSELMSQGYKVIGLARRKNLINANYSYECDVSNENDVKNVFFELKKQNIIPDTIICCAGIYEEDTTPLFDLSKVKKIIDINFFGTMNIVDTFLPNYLENKTGHFIVLSSIAAWKPSKRGISYSASKAAVAMAFRGLDLTYRDSGVNFSTVYLGPVETEMWEGKKTIILTSTKAVAKKLIEITKNPKPVSYFPLISTTLSRMSSLIPDDWYAKLSSYLFKK